MSDHNELSTLDDYLRSLPPPYDFYVSGARDYTDLEFLANAGSATSVGVNLGDRIDSLDGVRHLSAALRELSLSAIWLRRPSLIPLLRFTNLRSLSLDGDGQFRDPETIGRLHQLRTIRLGRRRDVDLGTLRLLPQLRHLEITGGSLRTPVAVSAELEGLRWLDLDWIRSLTHLTGLGDVVTLERLGLGQLSNLAALPDLTQATALRSVAIEKCRLVDDLTPLASAPALEQLILVDMPHLTPDHVRPLVGHPTLKYCSIGTGSVRRNGAIRDLLQLPEWPGPYFPADTLG